MKRACIRFLGPTVALFLIITAAYAGGWSIITVNALPDYAVAGKPLTLTFSVRQHGNNLIGGLTPAVRATTPQGGEVTASASPTKNKGEYSATLIFTRAGEWTILIDGGFNPEDIARNYNSVRLEPLKVIGADEPPPFLSDITRGERLFVAKGCAGCHGAGKGERDLRDLTEKRLPAGYLRKFLAEPDVRPGEMPDLNLKEDEISALAAFISSVSAKSAR